MEFEIILKFLLSVFLGIILLLSKKVKCNTDCFISSIILGISSTMSSILITTSKSNIQFLVFFSILIGIFAFFSVKKDRSTSFTIETLVIILISFSIGSGYYLLSFITVIISIFSSILIPYIVKLTLDTSLSVFIINIEEKASTIIDIKKILIDIGIKFKNIKLSKSEKGYTIELIINTTKNKNKEFIDKCMQLKGVIEMTSETF